MSEPQLVLVVDDEPATRKFVRMNLRARGYNALVAADGTEALKLAGEYALDLVILDIGIPGPNGFEVLDAIRRDSVVPVIMLSARAREADKVAALDRGADDYLTKPFGIEELLARVRAALRRWSLGSAGTAPLYRYDGLELDFRARRVRRDGMPIQLTAKEHHVLAYLARNAGKVLTHRQILQAVWGGEYGNEAEYIWTYINRIRRKIEPVPDAPRFVRTEPGMGYSMPEGEV